MQQGLLKNLMVVKQGDRIADYDRMRFVAFRGRGASGLPEPAYSIQPVERVIVHCVIAGLELPSLFLLLHGSFPEARKVIVTAWQSACPSGRCGEQITGSKKPP